MKQVNQKNISAAFTKKVMVGHCLALVALTLVMLVENNILKERSAKQAVSFIKRLVIENRMREVIYTLSMAEMEDFTGVIYFSDVGARVFSLPADLDNALITKKSPILSFTHDYLDIPIYFGNGNAQQSLAVVRFIYPRFSLFPYAIGVWVLALLLTLPIVQSTKKRLALQSEKELKAKTDAYKAEIASKVRHNIRSPLASFKTALNQKNEVFDRELITQAADRIEEIIAELQVASPTQKGLEKATNISESVMKIVTEKRVYLSGHFPKVNLKNNIGEKHVLVKIDDVEFRATLSNLIDNAIEAVQGAGEICVDLNVTDNKCVLEITDDGVGIEEEDLDRVFDKDFTKGKKKGSGLGLYYAKKLVDESRGFIEVESRMGMGSTFRITLPMVNRPKIPVEIKVNEDSDVVILEDQESLHSAWRLKFKGLDRVRLHFFKSPREMIIWHGQSSLNKPLYLVDYDLGEGRLSGADVIGRLKISGSSILVTGHADDSQVLAQCSSLPCALLPKEQLSAIPIVVNQN